MFQALQDHEDLISEVCDVRIVYAFSLQNLAEMKQILQFVVHISENFAGVV